MKILYVITQGDCGGAQKNVLDLAVGARQAGHHVIVATGRQETVSSQWLFDELRIFGFRRSSPSRLVGVKTVEKSATPPDLIVVPALQRKVRPLDDIVAFFQLRRLIRRLKPDIIHLHSSKAGSVGAVAAKLAWTGVKVIYTVHGFVVAEPLSKKEKFFYHFSEYIASFFRDLVITVSLRDQTIGQQEKLIHSPSVVIYNGLDQAKKAGILPFSRAREVLGRLLPEGTALTSNQRIIGVVANFYPSKGLSYLLEAIALLNQTNSHSDSFLPVPVIIIGDGMLRTELVKKIKDLNLEDNVFLVGAVDDAYRYLSAFDVVVLPSVKEGFPYVLLETLLAGRPFIASRVGGIPELVEMIPPGVGRLVPPADPRALASTLSKFFHESPPTAIRLPELFSLEHQRSATFAEYRRLLA